MEPRKEFISEEFVQYAAECRRMARLARKAESSRVYPYLGWTKWLDLARERFARLRHQRPAPLQTA
jgi:hypothetical protein